MDYNLLWSINLSKIVQILALKFENIAISWVDKRQTKDYNGMLRVHILNLHCGYANRDSVHSGRNQALETKNEP